MWFNWRARHCMLWSKSTLQQVAGDVRRGFERARFEWIRLASNEKSKPDWLEPTILVRYNSTTCSRIARGGGLGAQACAVPKWVWA